MVIHIITAGKLRDKNIRDIVGKYSKRISSTHRINWIEVDWEKPGRKTKSLQKTISQISKNCCVAVLSESGNEMSSEAFARWINRLNDSAKDVCFVIGSAEGLPESIIASADERISLSSMTFPHELVRAILAEQIYRAVSIIKGCPYHRK